ncbi:MAG: superoxide dismutase, Ni [Proteobacteria bacterium]|nr:superoxide dismutase, Ni [Pseudomonadota bacterium]MBU1641068.1 superoxide dismutase, Ni [Pseudomonadota bacterium]
MKKNASILIIAFAVLLIMAPLVGAHCEIPCGIYDDELRIALVLEHITTIEKSMNQIMELEKKDQPQSNQLIRWVMNKEEHADKLQEIVSQYFMTQRIKPSDDKYPEKLAALHQMLISAMKCKQSTDLSNVTTLRELTAKFKTLYMGNK